MKLFICFSTYILLIFSNIIIYTQDENDPPLENSELEVRNNSVQNRTITVRIYPVSMVFNGNMEYRLDAEHKFQMPTYEYNFINGRNNVEDLWYLTPGTKLKINHDYDHNGYGNNAAIGYGVYKLLVSWGSGNNYDTCTINYDAGYPGYLPADIIFEFRDNTDATGSGPRVVYHWSNCPVRNISEVGRKINAWDQCSGQQRSWDPGNIIYNSANGNNRTLLPQDYRHDCSNYENYPDLPGQWGIGLLTLNLTIDKDNVSTRLFYANGYRYDAPDQIVVSPNCTLTLNNNREFVIKYDPSYNEGLPENYNKFYVKANSVLRLKQNSFMKIEKTNWLILDCFSKVILDAGSTLLLDAGSKLCWRGGSVSGQGQFIVIGYVPSTRCYIPCVHDNIIEDSAKLVIDTNSVLELPDSTFIRFKGNETKLICKENSEIKFGKGSKLIFEDGARIIANGCRFTSYDSTDIWDGIYLSGIAYDTLKNCTFQNAINGINITDNYDPFGSPGAVEISDCMFKNSTSTELLNYVYVNNSYNVLFKGCNAVRTGSAGFTAGIIAEYCPAGGVVVCDNNINYVNTGISLLQSSEYIARNVISGYSNTGTGIYLDNSNGTIEYNTVNNFQKSIYGSYSSPYLLKNSLIDAYITNIDLVNSSMPVMKPVISSSTLRWLGGNNTITGYPPPLKQRHKIC